MGGKTRIVHRKGQEEDSTEEMASELNRLSEKIQQVMQKQQDINRKAEQKADQGDRTPDEQLSKQQQEVSKEIDRIRRSLQQQAAKADSEQKKNEDKNESEKKNKEEDLKDKKDLADSTITSASPEEGRPGKKVDDRAGTGGNKNDPSAQTNVSGSKSQNSGAGQQMRQLAEQLEKQRIEKTQNGFRTKTGLEGMSQENRKRLEQGRFRDAQEKGEELAQQLKQAQGKISQIQSNFGLQNTQEEMSESEQVATKSRATGSLKQSGLGAKAGQEGPVEEVFDEYQPSQFDPPQLRELKRRANQLSEFRDFQYKDDIMGRAAAEERYPLKYEGLVETYFQILTDSGQ